MATLNTSSLFLVSGGARGITAQCVVEMARHFRCSFILLGRTALKDAPAWAQGISDEGELKKRLIADYQARGEKFTPVVIGKGVNGVIALREIQGTLDAVKAAGGNAVYLSADVTDTSALSQALATVRHMGAVTGILHGAGNLADKLIENKTEADFENVYSAKVEGLENLLAVVPAASLDTLVLFSSVAGFYGNIGQADYAIANEILNKTAHQFKHQHPACHVVSINWGPWDGGMVTLQLRAYFDQLHIKVIPVEVGTRLLADELRAPVGDAPVQIVVGSAIRPQPTPADGSLPTYRLRRKLRLNENPFLGDHVVNSQAVMPMVTAMSWIGNACEQINRGYKLASFSNYRVLKGIVFDESFADEYMLDLKAISSNADALVFDAMIHSLSKEGKPRFHYNTQVRLIPEIPEAPVFDRPFELVVSAEIPGSLLYEDGTLFHGYSFQGVQQVLSLGEAGLKMRCRLPIIDQAYQGQFPVQAFNYFMCDIGLQSIGIWANRFYGMGSLPLRAAGGEFFGNADFGQEFFVTMQVKSHSPTNVTANITLHDAENRIYITISDLEVTMSKRLNEMFLKNRLPETV